jgi:hypothetical protein
MFDSDVYRQAFDAENRASTANARAEAASNSRDALREDLARLQKEAALAIVIAGEAFAALLSLDPRRADALAQTLLSQYGKYRDSREYPNLSGLLLTIVRPPPAMAVAVAGVGDSRIESLPRSATP